MELKIGAHVSTSGGISKAVSRGQEIGCEDMLAQLDAGPGSDSLVAIHANDSKRVCASGVDRHDNTGEGFIGEDGFAVFMGHPAFRDVSFLLEVPGFEGNGPDQRNVDILKAIRSRVGAAP
jgi:deoxyribonuclease-4